MRCARDVRTRTRRREGEGFEPVRPQWLEEKLKVRLLRLTVRPARTSYFTVPPTLAVYFFPVTKKRPSREALTRPRPNGALMWAPHRRPSVRGQRAGFIDIALFITVGGD